jgi:hypothetical protein
MKIFKHKKLNKILDIKFFKNKVLNYSSKKELNNLKLMFKTNFKLIFKYHMLNKKICLIGAFDKYNIILHKIFKETKHFYISTSFWFNGILSNSLFVLKHLILLKKLNRLVKFFKKLTKISLILVFHSSIEYLREIIFSKSPIILFSYFNSSVFDYFFNIRKNNFNILVFLNLLKSVKKRYC